MTGIRSFFGIGSNIKEFLGTIDRSTAVVASQAYAYLKVREVGPELCSDIQRSANWETDPAESSVEGCGSKMATLPVSMTMICIQLIARPYPSDLNRRLTAVQITHPSSRQRGRRTFESSNFQIKRRKSGL
jgi:hypothetical protein